MSPPSSPINRLGPFDGKGARETPIHKQDQIRRIVSCAGDEQAVKLQEMRRGRQSLGGGIVEGFVSRDIDTQLSQARDVGEPEAVFAPRGQFMNFVLQAAGPDRFEREPVSDLG